MPRGRNSAKTNRSYGQKRWRIIGEYRNNPFPIDRENMEPFIPDADEIFVPVFHYVEINVKNAGQNEKRGMLSKRWIVSNKGNVISFEKPDRPKWLKPILKNREQGENSYIFVDYWDLHRLVWFSFAADAIVNNKELPKHYRIHDSFWTLDGLLELADLGSEEFGKIVMVHHEDLNPQNNKLDNLELLPNNEDDEISEAWHSWLHDLMEMNEEDKADAIAKKRITEPTIIFAEPDYGSISKLQVAQLHKMEQDGGFDLLQIRLSILKKIAEEKKGEYLKKERVISVQTDEKVELDRFSAEVVDTTLKLYDVVNTSTKIDCIFELKKN